MHFLLLVVAGCSSTGGGPAAAPPSRQALREVVLPDLSTMAPPVQAQLREKDAALTRVMQNSAAPPAELATAYGELGKLLLAAESFTEAEPCFLNAQLLAPGEGRWPYFLGHVYRLRGESLEAVASFERARQSDPTNVAALVWLGDAYLDQGRLEQAEPLFEKALSLQPRLLAARFGLGRVALARRDYARAVEHLEAALALDRRASVVRYPLAMAYRGLGQVAKAEAHLRQRGEVEISPPDPLMQEVAEALQSAVAYESRGDRALAREDFAAAAEQYKKGLELAPDKLSIRDKLATALSLTNDVPGAVQQFQELLRRSPEFAEAHYGLGALHVWSRRDDLAIERFAAAVRYDPTYLEARLQLANALRRRGRAEAALGRYAEVIAIDPRVGEARFGQALVLVRLKRYREARDVLADGIRTYPERREFAHALARLLASAPDDRIRDGRQALALAESIFKDVQTSQVRETIAMAFAEAGQFEQAVTWQREAIAARGRERHDDAAPQLADNLRLYERGKPCRTPWRDDPAWLDF